MTSRFLLVCLVCLVAACGGAASSPPEAPAASPRACEEAHADLVRYYEADPEQRRPPARAEVFVAACRELPPEAQRCLLFSYMQAHASPCDAALGKVDPALMRRIADLGGKK